MRNRNDFENVGHLFWQQKFYIFIINTNHRIGFKNQTMTLAEAILAFLYTTYQTFSSGI